MTEGATLRTALITGITGQDGSYLAELLLEKGYRVHGLVRRDALLDPEHRMWRIRHLLDDLTLHIASIADYASVFRAISEVKPLECYHLAAQSFVSDLLEDEMVTLRTDISATHCVLRAIKEACPTCRFYFASSSEMFGAADSAPQTERSPLHPRSAYGVSKVAGYGLTCSYREAHKLYAVSGIAYNHESPRRGFGFVTRKITSHVARISLGRADKLVLGNLDAVRDWGHAKDFVKAMWLMLQRDEPEDFVIASGRATAVRDFCRLAFERVGLDYAAYTESSPVYFRPSERVPLTGDASKAGRLLGWKPSISLESLASEMVDADLRLEESRP